MRDIRFRAWDKKGNKMIYIQNWWDCATEVLAQSACDLPCEVGYWKENIEIQQFTGLLDKNGKEIYEGDRLKVDGKHYYIVIWFDDGACFRYKSEVLEKTIMFDKERFIHYESPLNYDDVEVIGNVYETPIEKNDEK